MNYLVAIGTVSVGMIWVAGYVGSMQLEADRKRWEKDRISQKEIFKQISMLCKTQQNGTIVDEYTMDDDEIEWCGTTRGKWGDAHAVAKAIETQYPNQLVDVYIQCAPIQYIGMSMTCACTDTYIIKSKN